MKTPLLGKHLRRAVQELLNKGAPYLCAPRTTCVVVPDATRPLPFEDGLRPLFEALHSTHSPTTVLIGLGLHRPMTGDELAPLRRAIGALPIELFQHDATSPGDSTHLNPQLLGADRIICIGTVEPHQYAGFSGGIKALSIGCADHQTISRMHGLDHLRDLNTTLGQLTNNPFQQDLWRIAEPLQDHQILGLQFVPAPGGGITDLFFDEIQPAFHQACDIARELYFEEHSHRFDWLHLPVPDLKATNFYQASRAATYAALVKNPALHPGATILIEAACPEKIGTGTGEQACAAAMKRGKHILLQELASTSNIQTRGGEQRAYILARACSQFEIALIGAPPMEELSIFGIPQFASFQLAQSTLTLSKNGRQIDDIFHRVPIHHAQ